MSIADDAVTELKVRFVSDLVGVVRSHGVHTSCL